MAASVEGIHRLVSTAGEVRRLGYRRDRPHRQWKKHCFAVDACGGSSRDSGG